MKGLSPLHILYSIGACLPPFGNTFSELCFAPARVRLPLVGKAFSEMHLPPARSLLRWEGFLRNAPSAGGEGFVRSAPSTACALPRREGFLRNAPSTGACLTSTRKAFLRNVPSNFTCPPSAGRLPLKCTFHRRAPSPGGEGFLRGAPPAGVRLPLVGKDFFEACLPPVCRHFLILLLSCSWAPRQNA